MADVFDPGAPFGFESADDRRERFAIVNANGAMHVMKGPVTHRDWWDFYNKYGGTRIAPPDDHPVAVDRRSAIHRQARALAGDV